MQIVRRPKRGDGAVCVIDTAGKRLKISTWMLTRDCGEMKITEQPRLSKEALLSLAVLISSHPDSEGHVHDNLLETTVDAHKGGRRGATTTSDLMIRKECGDVPMDATTRAELIDLMARVLVVVFREEGGGVDDRGLVSSQD